MHSLTASLIIGLSTAQLSLAATRGSDATRHLSNSKEFFLAMVDKVRALDREQEAAFIADRDYEGLERFIVNHLLGI